MRISHWLALGATAVGLSAGCARPSAPAGPIPAAAGPSVSVVKPERRPVTRVIEQPGTVQPFEESVLVPKIPGYVRGRSPDPDKADRAAHDRLIDIGSRVKKDQVLAELSAPELDEEFKQKEALVRQSAAEVAQSKKAVAAATAGVDAARAYVSETKAALTRAHAQYDRWQSEANRVARLVSGGVIDAQSRDETVNQFKAAEALRAEAAAKVVSAEAAVTKADADRDKAIADVAAAEAKRDVATADVRRVDALRGYLHIRAPYDGTVTRRAANTGDYVTADGKQGLFAIARVDPVRVVIHVPEADAGLVAPGQEARVTIPALPGPAKVGTIVRTSWALEPGSRTLRAEVDLPNADARVRPGMYVITRLAAVLPVEWSVPTAAVGKVNDESVAYLVEGGKAVRVAVQLARGDSQFTQVRSYKRPGSSEWTDFTGAESIATPSAAVTAGQSVP